MKKNPTERFTDRVANYILYRPHYPALVTEYLQATAGLAYDAKIAEIGSGTGIFTKNLLDKGWKVFAVEPNEAMRNAADELLTAYPNYLSVDGNAADTRLGDHSMDAIICAQAFHWFNNTETRSEFHRILKRNGLVALIWNNRLVTSDAFAHAYDELLKNLSIDYNAVNHQKLTHKEFEAFYKDGQYRKTAFPNEQIFDEAGLIGRAKSASYVPSEDTPEGKKFFKQLQAIFDRYAQNGRVRFVYETEVYTGTV